MRKLLLIIDVQNGFINDHSSWLPAKLAEYIRAADYTAVYATVYKNNATTPEDQEVCPELDDLYSFVFEKNTHNSVTRSLYAAIESGSYEEIHIAGITSRCCVLITAYDLIDKGFNAKVIPSLCASAADSEEYAQATELVIRENLPCLEISDIITNSDAGRNYYDSSPAECRRSRISV